MNAHDHAAQLAEALRGLTEAIYIKSHGGIFDNQGVHVGNAYDEARAALAAWDKHNAPAPKQEALL